MRPFCLFLSLLCVLTLTACGTEDEVTAPVFSNIMVNGAVVSSSYTDSTVNITGNIDDFFATIVASSTVSGEVSVAVDSNDGSWSFPFTLQAGTNVISIIASDQRGNLNQLTLNLLYEPSIPN